MGKIYNFLLKLCAKYTAWWLIKKYPNNPVERNITGYKFFKKEVSKFIKNNY